MEVVYFLLVLIPLLLYQYVRLNELRRSRLLAERTRREATLANREEREFLHHVSQELLLLLEEAVEMAARFESAELTGERLAYLESFNATAEIARALLGDVLQRTQGDSGTLQPNWSSFDIKKTIQEVCVALRNRSLRKMLELTCEIGSEVPQRVIGDGLRFRQVLYSLLSLALRSPDRSEVVVRVHLKAVETDDNNPLILLEIGGVQSALSREELERVFDCSRRTDAQTSKPISSIGGELKFARDLVRLMNGQIGVQNDPRQGTFFWAKLPLMGDRSSPVEQLPDFSGLGLHALVYDPHESSRDAASSLLGAMGISSQPISSSGRFQAHVAQTGHEKAPAFIFIGDSPQGRDLKSIAAVMKDEYGFDVPVIYLTYPGRSLVLDKSFEYCLYKPCLPDRFGAIVAKCLHAAGIAVDADRQTGGAKKKPDQARQGVRVLVAEDNRVSEKILATFLDRMGCVVTLTRNGKEALHAASTEQFSVAIVDLSMPELDGFEFALQYRAQETGGQHLPIVALTASAEEVTKKKCLEVGMDAFLNKPIVYDQLSSIIARYGGR